MANGDETNQHFFHDFQSTIVTKQGLGFPDLCLSLCFLSLCSLSFILSKSFAIHFWKLLSDLCQTCVTGVRRVS
jgi:hypothetical protein